MNRLCRAILLAPFACLLAALPARSIVAIDSTDNLSELPDPGFGISPFVEGLDSGQWMGTTFRTGSERVRISNFTANVSTGATQNDYYLGLYSVGANSFPDQLLASAPISLPPTLQYASYAGSNLGPVGIAALNPGSFYALVIQADGPEPVLSGTWSTSNLGYSEYAGFSQVNTITKTYYTSGWELVPDTAMLCQLEVTPIPAPGPLPIAAGLMAWRSSRKLRRAVNSRNRSSSDCL